MFNVDVLSRISISFHLISTAATFTAEKQSYRTSSPKANNSKNKKHNTKPSSQPTHKPSTTNKNPTKHSPSKPLSKKIKAPHSNLNRIIPQSFIKASSARLISRPRQRETRGWRRLVIGCPRPSPSTMARNRRYAKIHQARGPPRPCPAIPSV